MPLDNPAKARRLPPRTFTHVKGWGPSLMLGVGAIGNKGWLHRLAQMPGLLATVNNYGVGGSTVMWDHNSSNSGYSRTLTDLSATIKAQNARPYAPWPVGENHLCCVDGGGADFYSTVNTQESFGANPRDTIQRAVMARRVMISRCLAAYIIENGSFTFSSSPAWVGSVQFNANSGSSATYANAEGCWCEVALPSDLPPGAVVAIGGLAHPANFCTLVDFTIGGSSIGTINPSLYKPNRTRYNGWVKRFKVGTGAGELAPYTAHTIRMTFTGHTGFGALIDYAQIETPLRQVPCVLVPNFVKFYSNTLQWGTNLADRDAITDEYNVALKAMVEEFGQAGQVNPARLVDFDAGTNKNLAYYTYERQDLYGAGDGIHPGDVGYAAQAVMAYEALLDWYNETHRFEAIRA